MRIFMIKNNIILDKEIDDNMFICYFVMNNLFNGNDYIYVNLDILCYEIYGKMDVDKRKRSIILNAINKLSEKKIINIISSNGKTSNCTYVISTNELSVKDCIGGFTKITKEEFDKCKDNFSMFRYFCVMMSTVNNDDKHKMYKAWFNMSSLLDKCTISNKTQYRYNEELEKRELIHIYRSKLVTKTEFGYKQLADVYGRYEDKDRIDKLGFSNDEMYGYGEKQKNLEANKRRSIKSYYNSFTNGTYKKDVYELMASCEEYNKYSSDKLDMSVFEEYKNKQLLEAIDRELEDEVFDDIEFN